MTIEETADRLIDQAEIALASRDASMQTATAGQINAFLLTNRVALLNGGSSWRVDQLDAAYGTLTGNGPGAVAPQTSPFWNGVKSFANDSTSLDSTVGAAATEQARRLGSGLASVANAGTKEALKSPAVLAVVVVGGVLALSWAYRSFK